MKVKETKGRRKRRERERIKREGKWRGVQEKDRSAGPLSPAESGRRSTMRELVWRGCWDGPDCGL